MRDIIYELITDFNERELPSLHQRNIELSDMAGKIKTIIGMRRVGKTSLCYQKISKLLSQGVSQTQILYLNFEDERLLPFKTEDFRTILDTWYILFPENKDMICYVFFDEIQNIPHWDKFIRRILDTEKLEIFLTGSSSKLLSSEIATALRGRSLSTEVFPYSFREILQNKGIDYGEPNRIGSLLRSKISHAFLEYLDVGGFPEVQNLSKELRFEILRNYVDTVVLRDLVERHHISNVQCVRALLRQILHAPSQLFSISKCYQHLKSQGIPCTKSSLFEYVDHLSDAFLIYQIPILSNSEKVRQVNPKKCYVIDTGLIKAMSHRTTADRGFLLENMIFMELRRRGLSVEYASTKKGYEIDFVVRAYPESPLSESTLIQVSWDIEGESTKERELRSLRCGLEEYGAKEAILITAVDEISISDSKIKIIPAWKWLLTD
jgi:predicted AAA+ superfamily ATPase